MHSHVELWVPERTSDPNKLVDRIMARFVGPFCDYYSVGGRWTGEHDGYDPSSDVENYSVCDCCKGTGTRSDDIPAGMNQDYIRVNGCNGCQGCGLTMDWTLKPHPGDILELEKVQDKLTCCNLIVVRFGPRGGLKKPEKFDSDGWKNVIRVKPKLQELGITNGILITLDTHY